MKRLMRTYRLGMDKWHVRSDLFVRPNADGQMSLL